MSGGKASVQCLLCAKTFAVKNISEHIHGHIRYKPQQCNDCGFDCVQRSELDQHILDTDHSGSNNIDPYKQWLVETINEDTIFAARRGMEELLKKKNLASRSLPATPQPSTSRINTPPQQQKQRQSLPARRTPSPSSGDEEEEQRFTAFTAPAVVQRRSNDRPLSAPVTKPQKNSDEGESEDDEHDKEIDKLRKELLKAVDCVRCRKPVRINLVDRLEHVRLDHMDGNPKDPGYDIRLESEILAAFPGLVSNWKQCRKCPKQKPITSDHGRIGHIFKYHNHYIAPFACLRAGCAFKSKDITTAFKEHFIKNHRADVFWKRSLSDGEKCVLAQYRIELKKICRLLFPVEIPEKDAPKRKEDEEEVAVAAEELRAIRDAAPPRPTQPLSKKAKFHSKHDYSDEEDSNSDDDKPPISRKPKEKEVIVKRQTDGTMALVIVSSDEDSSMEVDDKEEAKSGSAVGKSCSGVDKSNQENGKREQSPEVKTEDEIEEVPVTPGARAQAGLLPKFTGRKLPPAGQGPNPFPSHRESAAMRHQVLRGQRGGGGGDRGDWRSDRGGFRGGRGGYGGPRGGGGGGVERGGRGRGGYPAGTSNRPW